MRFFLILIFLCPIWLKAQYFLPRGSQVDSLRFVNEFRIPHEASFQDVQIGGFSGIEWDGEDFFYLLSDDRSQYGPARFYKAQMSLSNAGIEDVKLKKLIPILTPHGQEYETMELDPESIRIHPLTKKIWISTEGDDRHDHQPFIHAFRADGSFADSLSVPENLKYYQKGKRGLRNNGSLEGLSFDREGQILWVINEEPLYEDGISSQPDSTYSPLRLSKINTVTGELLAQYAYFLEPVPAHPAKKGGVRMNSASELLWINEESIWVMERSYVAGVGNFVRIFNVDLLSADDVKDQKSLENLAFQPLKKNLVLDVNASGAERVDNLEGMSFGPSLSNGNPTLVLVSDNNFNPKQVNQFLLYEIIISNLN